MTARPPKPTPPLTGGLLFTGAVFVLAAGLGYHLGGRGPLRMHPLRPGGPEVRVATHVDRASVCRLWVQGAFAYGTAGTGCDLGEVPMTSRRGRGWLRVQAAPRGLRLFRPGGPPEGEALLAGVRVEGEILRIAGSKEPVWGALDVVRTGPDRLVVINVLDLETYLQGVLIPEMGANFPLEALKAQAVAARTYALAHLVRAKKQGRTSLLRRTELDQVFRAVASVPERIRRAVDETRGEVLGTPEEPITTYYHSTCGGATRDAAPHFDPSSPLRGRRCRFCRSSRLYRWERRYDLSDLTRALRAESAGIVPPIRAFRLTRDRTGHTVQVVVVHEAGATPVPGGRFRSRINRALARDRSQQLLSTNLESIGLTAGGKTVRVRGRGWGHGVGMCQVGAARLAGRGFGYRQILAFYYGRQPLTRAWGGAP